MQDFLLALGFIVNHKRVRRLLRLMGLMAIYPKRILSKLGLKKYIHLYLLKGLDIDRHNKAWAIDVSAPGSDNLSTEISPAVYEPAVEILPRCKRGLWRKGAVKSHPVLRMRRNKQNSLNCTEDRPFSCRSGYHRIYDETTKHALEASVFNRQPPVKKWLWRYVVSFYGLYVAMRETLCLVMGYPHSHYPEPPAPQPLNPCTLHVSKGF